MTLPLTEDCLTVISDALLPKLMSGELRVSTTGKLPEVIE